MERQMLMILYCIYRQQLHYSTTTYVGGQRAEYSLYLIISRWAYNIV
jgi:hypothetical protein